MLSNLRNVSGRIFMSPEEFFERLNTLIKDVLFDKHLLNIYILTMASFLITKDILTPIFKLGHSCPLFIH